MVFNPRFDVRIHLLVTHELDEARQRPSGTEQYCQRRWPRAPLTSPSPTFRSPVLPETAGPGTARPRPLATVAQCSLSLLGQRLKHMSGLGRADVDAITKVPSPLTASSTPSSATASTAARSRRPCSQVNFTVKDSHFEHARGRERLKTFSQSQTIASGKAMTNYFCENCGTLMYRVGEAFPGVSILRIGHCRRLLAA